MKKRCTVSSCRRVFNRDEVVCPYCGKVYSGKVVAWEVRIVKASATVDKMKEIGAYRRLMGCGLMETLHATTYRSPKKGLVRRYPYSYGIYDSEKIAQYVAEYAAKHGLVAQIEGIYKLRSDKLTVLSQDAINLVTPLKQKKFF